MTEKDEMKKLLSDAIWNTIKKKAVYSEPFEWHVVYKNKLGKMIDLRE